MNILHYFTQTFLIVIIYCIILIVINYVLMKHTETFYTNEEKEKMKMGELFVNSIYFTTTTVTSIGYGDISPKTYFGKLIIILEQLGLLFVTFSLTQTENISKVENIIHNYSPKETEKLIETIDILKGKRKTISADGILDRIFEARDKFLAPVLKKRNNLEEMMYNKKRIDENTEYNFISDIEKRKKSIVPIS